MQGKVSFDYSNNSGHYFIGQAEMMFELKFSKSSDMNIVLYNDPESIHTIAIAKGITEIQDIKDARLYDGSSRTRRPNTGQIAILQNSNGFYCAIKIMAVTDDKRGADADEIVFDYFIQTNGSP